MPKLKKTYTVEQVISMYKKGFSLINIQNFTGCPSTVASKIVKEAGIFNPKRHHGYFFGKQK